MDFIYYLFFSFLIMFKIKDTFYYLKSKLKNKSLFLYIELWVFLLIWIIAVFIGYSSFTTGDKNSRDATRLAYLLTISDELKIYYSKNNNYPLPEGAVTISSSWEILTYQWYFWKTISDMLKISEITDPIQDKNYKYLNYYTYSINEKKQNFQLMGFMEKSDQITYNPLESRTPFNYWEKLWIAIEQKTSRPIQETKLWIDILKTTDLYSIYLDDKSIISWDNTKLKVLLAQTYKSKSFSCKEIKESGLGENGYYYIQPLIWTSYEKFSKTIKVYCDMESDGWWWTRLYYKNGKETCLNDWVTYNSFMLEKLFTKDFAVSDKLETLKSEWSWILHNIIFDWKKFTFDKLKNVSNCKTPTNTNWSNSYSEDHLRIYWTLMTLWKWTKMFFWCWEYKNTGENVILRMWWEKHNKWDFIHSSCGDYKNNLENSISSRWETENVRVIWVR